jgi:signal peptidase I
MEQVKQEEQISIAPAATAKASDFFSFIKTLSVIIVLAVFLRSTVVEAFKIPSGSMRPTLREGDYIFVWKLSYGIRLPFMQKAVYEFAMPKRGNVVVFTRPDDPNTKENEASTNIIKRVIGLPGDKIEVSGSKLFVNGELMVEDYARWEDGGTLEGNFGPQVVPDGHVLLLGDNRDHSKDGRFWNYPFLPVENIKGRAFIIYWSWSNFSRFGTIIR